MGQPPAADLPFAGSAALPYAFCASPLLAMSVAVAAGPYSVSMTPAYCTMVRSSLRSTRKVVALYTADQGSNALDFVRFRHTDSDLYRLARQQAFVRAFKEQVGGTLNENSWGETDLFGKLTATYVAGFAAKTAIIVARDMTSNDTGAEPACWRGPKRCGCARTWYPTALA